MMKLSARYCLVPVSLLVSTVYGSGCSGTNLRSSPPDNNTFVGLKNFSICDGNLSATVRSPPPAELMGEAVYQSISPSVHQSITNRFHP